VFWVHAGSAERMEKGYLDIAKEVGIPGWDSVDPTIDKSALVREWFERKAPGKWILILDNADDMEMLYGGPARPKRLADYFPRAPNGAILLTTRNRKVGTQFTAPRNIIRLPALDIGESVRLLQARISSDDAEEQYRDLATALQNVPLALVQAAAFISAQQSSIAEYLRLYNRSDASRIQLLSDEFSDDIRDRDTQNAIAATFVISFEQIRKSDSHAIEMLSFMGMLDPQAIPRSLLSDNRDGVVFTKALGTLLAYSLITESTQQGQEDQLYDLHRLIRLAIHEWLSSNHELQISILKATLTMAERFPYLVHPNRETCRTYFPHALAILSSHQLPHDLISSPIIRPSHTAQKEIQVAEADLLYRVSNYLMYKGDYRLGQSMAQQSLAIREKVLGKEHVKTLDSMDQSEWYLGQQGKVKEAIEPGRRTLQLREKTLGRKHPSTLDSMVGLGFNLNRQGKHREANHMFQEALVLQREVLGEEHELTSITMRYLSQNLNEQGQHEEAEKMARRTLQLQMKVLGDEHPHTFFIMNDLAWVLGEQEKYEEAEQMARRTLQLRRKVLGDEHPDTLNSMNGLTWILGAQEKYEEAEQMARRTLQLRRKVLGDEHPDTIASTNNLHWNLSRQGKHDEAEQTARLLRQSQPQVLGETRPPKSRTLPSPSSKQRESGLARFFGRRVRVRVRAKARAN
jgi:tetratricopeptide (TPR) repeat protein